MQELAKRGRELLRSPLTPTLSLEGRGRKAPPPWPSPAGEGGDFFLLPVDAVIAPPHRDKAAVVRDYGIDVELVFNGAVERVAFGLAQAAARGLVEVAHGSAVMIVLGGAVGVEQIEQDGRHAALLHAGLRVAG